MDLYEQQDLKAQREQINKIQAYKDAQDFIDTASTLEGRNVLRRMLAECGIYRSSFRDQATAMAFAEGKRAIGLWLLEQFNACPDLYLQLLTEKQDDRRSHITD